MDDCGFVASIAKDEKASLKPSDASLKPASELKSQIKLVERFQASVVAWQKELPMDPDHPEIGSWLDGVWEDNFAVVCKCCRAVQAANSWATGITTLTAFQKCHALRHHNNCETHIKSVQKFLGRDIQQDDNKTALKQALSEVWADAVKGLSFQAASNNTTGSRHKVARLIETLGEGLKENDRKVIRAASVVALHQDSREGVLCVRYSASTETSVHHGVLGFAHSWGTTSAHLCEAVQEILRDFATDYQGRFDEGLLRHLCQVTELLNGDGASDEQRSIRLLSSARGGTPPVFPNIKVLVRDCAHGARRLTSRPWTVDRYLSFVIEKYVSRSDSIIHLIQNSPDIKSIFASHCGKGPTNLRFAAHRYDSMYKPLSRLVTQFDAVWSTALDIANARRGTDPGKHAGAFLSTASVESLIQCAMLADAAAEAMDVVRFLDSEDYDLSSLPETLGRFIHRIDCLFLREEVLKLGHTAVMIASLLRERTCLLPGDGAIRSLGGPGAVGRALLQRCLDRMCVWVRLAVERIDLEFPSWRLLQAFEVFDLSQARSDDSRKALLIRLGQEFGIADHET